MGRYFAGRLMKELGLVSCQQPAHRYKQVVVKCHYPGITLGAAVRSDRAKSGMVRRRDVHLDGKRWAYLAVVLDPFARKPVGWAYIVLSGQQTDHQSAENGTGNPQ